MTADEDSIPTGKSITAREAASRSIYPSVDDLLVEEIEISSSKFGRENVKSELVDCLMETKELVKIYDDRRVVNGVDIHVKESEVIGLLGPNGAGKTTSFYMIVGLVRPDHGQVLFNGIDATNLPMHQRARLGMGYLPQEESIFRKLTVYENLMAVIETRPLSFAERK